MVCRRECFRITPVRLKKSALALCLALATVPWAGAQTLYHINLKGTATGLDAGGNTVNQPVNNATVIREWAGRAGVTNVNLKTLDLVLHQNNGFSGDAIEVVHKSDGSLVNSAFLLAYSEPAADTT